jgi:hypothetical protein
MPTLILCLFNSRSERVVLSAIGCTVASTNLQPKPAAEPETVVSAKTFH